MKKTVIATLFLFSFFSNLNFAESLTTTRLQGEFSYAPLASEEFYTINGYNLKTAWMLGRQKERYLAGFQFSGDFMLLTPILTNGTLAGPQYNLSGLLISGYRIGKEAEVSWGFGGFWQHNSFAINESLSLNSTGCTFHNTLSFPVGGLSFLTLELISNLDLIFALDSEFKFNNFALNYGGGLKILVNSGLNWLKFSLEARGFYWNYSNNVTEINTGSLTFGAGISIDTQFRQKPSPLPQSTPTPEPPATSSPTPSPRELLYETEPGLLVLKAGIPGQVAEFYGILFTGSSTMIEPSAYALLDEIATILGEGRQKVSIAAYAIFTENPGADRDLHVARSKVIIQYLQDRGVKKENLLITAGAILLISLEDKKPKVSFTLLK